MQETSRFSDFENPMITTNPMKKFLETGFDNKEQMMRLGIRYDSGHSKIYCCRSDPQSIYTAFGCEDGYIRLYKKGSSNSTYKLQGDYDKDCPVSCLRFKPTKEQENILISGHGDGRLIIWHVTTKQILRQLENKENPLYGIDINSENVFATGGQDKNVRIYDLNKLSKWYVLSQDEGHSNRIFGIKFKDPNVLLTAGWDKVILIWDLRVKKNQNFIYGPMICGDSLDCLDNQILAGSYTTENQIGIYDLRTLNKIHNIDLQKQEWTDPITNVYSGQFINDGERIVVGTTGVNSVQMYDIKQSIPQCLDAIYMRKGIYSLDKQTIYDKIIYSGADGLSGCIDIL